MNHSLYLSAVVVAAGLAACDNRPAVVAVPSPSPSTAVVPVPGPAGPPGQSGSPGMTGSPGKPGDTAVIVIPPASAPK